MAPAESETAAGDATHEADTSLIPPQIRSNARSNGCNQIQNNGDVLLYPRGEQCPSVEFMPK